MLNSAKKRDLYTPEMRALLRPFMARMAEIVLAGLPDATEPAPTDLWDIYVRVVNQEPKRTHTALSRADALDVSSTLTEFDRNIRVMLIRHGEVSPW